MIEPLGRLLIGDGLERSIGVAFGAVALVLLIACANVANLLLARAASRRRELAVRAALGASRGRLVTQLLAESTLVCLMGGAAGITVAGLLIRAARPMLAESLPFTADVGLNLSVLAFAAAVAFGVALAAGALPARRAAFGNPAESLNLSARGSSGAHARLRRAIVVGEVALSLVLVSGALLLLRSLLKLQQLDTGVRMEDVIATSIDLPAGAYPTPEKAALFYRAVAERLRGAPGVSRVGLATHLPLQWINNGEALLIPGIAEMMHVRFKRVDPGYFATLGIPVLAGRGITGQDREGTPRVVVINQALAERLAAVAHISDPVGKVVRVSTPGYVEKREFIPEVRIVGVIRSERVSSPGTPDPPVVYVPLAQAPSTEVKLLIRADPQVTGVAAAMRGAVHEIDPNLPMGEVATMTQVRERTLVGRQPAGRADRRLRGDGDAAGRDRAVRRAVPHGDAAAQGDRHPHGARSAAAGYPLARSAERSEYGGGGAGSRNGRDLCPDPSHEEPVIRGVAARSVGAHAGVGGDGRARHCGGAATGAARGERGPGDNAARGRLRPARAGRGWHRCDTVAK